jgi:hypothetical protein
LFPNGFEDVGTKCCGNGCEGYNELQMFHAFKNPFSQKIPYLGYSHAVAILDTVVFDQLLN